MSLVISSSYVITGTASGGGTIDGDNPIIGWRNLVEVGNITTTTAEAANPASHMANPSTNLRWVGELSSPEQDEYITLNLDTADPIDYIGVARHNWGSAQIAVSVEVLDTDASPDAWEELIASVMLPNDGPVIFRFPPQTVSSIRIRLQPGSEAPTAAVVYAGALLILQRKIYVGHTPINYGRNTKVTNARSESGNFLGRIVLGRSTATAVEMKNLTPDWYRANIEPWLLNAQELPFFFAWRPASYPREVGFGWLTGDPKPSNQLPNGMMSFSFNMGGVT